MEFEALWPWLLWPPLVLYAGWLARRSYARLSPRAQRTSFALRAVLLTLLVAAVSRPVWMRDTDQRRVVFAVDVSQSVTEDNVDAALAEVDRLAKAAFEQSQETRVDVIAFGAEPVLVIRNAETWNGWPDDLKEKLQYRASLPKLHRERTERVSAGNAAEAELKTLEERIARVDAFSRNTAGEHTDVERAIRLAMNCGQPEEHHVIYLVTDGHANHGEWRRATARIDGRQAELHVVKLDRPLLAEVAATAVQLPASVRVNEGFTALACVVSTVETEAELRVFKDGFAVQQDKVKLVPGENRFDISRLYFREKGFHTVEIDVQAEDDTLIQNNRVRSLLVVPGEARVLYVDGDEDQMPYLKQALELEGMIVEARPATGVPQSLSELLSFDAMILSNVPADRLSRRQMQMVQSYVQDFGGGFIMLGGEESFGLGGYFRTPIEEILPVRMPIQKDMIRPSLALMLVIDKSGSMSGVKIQLAKRAAVATAEAINPRDMIGVVGFDGEARVILELTQAVDHAGISNRIASLDAGGGTFLYPALEIAHSRLMESNARKKHVIILSDGATQGHGYEDFAQLLAADGISVSTVGIGDDADMRLMEAIAAAGGGRSYYTNDFYSIPQIFTREALRASKNMLVERLVQPMGAGHDVALEEIDVEELPLLTGYVATTPKAAANVILVTDAGDPLLAKWRFGLGQTVAFTSETKPRWAEDWIEWPDFAKFWSQLIRSVTGEDLAKEVSLDCRHALQDDQVVLTADIQNAEGDFISGAKPVLTTPTAQGGNQEVPVEQIGAGLYRAIVDRIEYGKDQQFLWQVETTAGEPQAVPYGFVYSFSPEFGSLGVDDATLSDIQRETGGQLARVGEAKMAESRTQSRHGVPLWPVLLIVAILLVPFDILCRRVG